MMAVWLLVMLLLLLLLLLLCLTVDQPVDRRSDVAAGASESPQTVRLAESHTNQLSLSSGHIAIGSRRHRCEREWAMS